MLYAAKGKKPGKAKGSKNAVAATPKLSRPASVGGGLAAIEQIVSREVQARINVATRAAITELKKLIR